ncbi:Os10g0409566, partial [Oryza sativa Japonica Group]
RVSLAATTPSPAAATTPSRGAACAASTPTAASPIPASGPAAAAAAVGQATATAAAVAIAVAAVVGAATAAARGAAASSPAADTTPTVACAATAPTSREAAATGRGVAAERARGARGGACNQRCRRGHLGRVRDAQLLQQEGVACRCEAQEDVRSCDVVGGVGEVVIEASKKVEDELGLRDGVADIAKGVSGSLHLLAVVDNGGIALNHGVKLMAEKDRSRLFVGVEHVLDGDPQLPSGLIWLQRSWMSSATDPKIQLRM